VTNTAGTAYNIPAYAGPEPGTPAVKASSLDGALDIAHITSSRIAVAAKTNQQVMNDVIKNKSPGSNYEAANYNYRLHVLESIYGDNSGKYPLYYFRLHPQLLQGCASFGVDWTDGSVSGGNLNWYGSGVANSGQEAANVGSDNYCMVFSFDNRANWPKALRFTFRVADRNQRLSASRDFVFTVRVPN
jgi:hypothetical protein